MSFWSPIRRDCEAPTFSALQRFRIVLNHIPDVATGLYPRDPEHGAQNKQNRGGPGKAGYDAGEPVGGSIDPELL